MTSESEIIERITLWEGFLRLRRYRLCLRVPHPEAGSDRSLVVDRECIEGLAAALVLPFDPRSGRIVLVEQVRVGALQSARHGLIWEPPGGIIAAGESAAAAARREAWEEAGCRLGAMTRIGLCRPCPGYSDEIVELFCGQVQASGLPAMAGDPREDERTRVGVFELDAVLGGLGHDPFSAATLMISVHWLALNRERLESAWAAGVAGESDSDQSWS